MKIGLYRTSEWDYKEVREYPDLETCIDELLSKPELFPTISPELVISKYDDKWMTKNFKDCRYIVEIYDTYRE